MVKKSNKDKLNNFDFVLQLVLDISVLVVVILSLFPSNGIIENSLNLIATITIVPALLLIVRYLRFKKFQKRDYVIVLLLLAIYLPIIYFTALKDIRQ